MKKTGIPKTIISFMFMALFACRATAGGRSLKENMKEIIVHKTTETEVLKLLGEPESKAIEDNSIIYHYCGSDYLENPVNYIPGVGIPTFLLGGYGNYCFEIFIKQDENVSLDFIVEEFQPPMSPEGLIQALTNNEVVINGEASSIEKLNRILEYQDLYKYMRDHGDDETRGIISILRNELPLNPLEIKRLNRILLEVNYPLNTPKVQDSRKVYKIESN